MLALIPSIIADVSNPYPKYAWWTIAYMLCCIVGITSCFATNSVNHYNLAVSDQDAWQIDQSLTCADCGVPRSRSRYDNFSRQLPHLSGSGFDAGCRCWLRRAVDRCGKSIASARLRCPDPFRLSGSSTSARVNTPAPANMSISSP